MIKVATLVYQHRGFRAEAGATGTGSRGGTGKKESTYRDWQIGADGNPLRVRLSKTRVVLLLTQLPRSVGWSAT